MITELHVTRVNNQKGRKNDKIALMKLWAEKFRAFVNSSQFP